VSKLLIVCPNLAVDRILEVPNFRSSAVLRTSNVIVQPGGKGSNVARVYRQLGGEVLLAGVVGRENSDVVSNPLIAAGVHVDLLQGYSGLTRTCTVIVDSASHNHPTVINEESGPVDFDIEDRLLEIVDKWIPESSALLVTGSLPRGFRSDFYRRVFERAGKTPVCQFCSSRFGRNGADHRIFAGRENAGGGTDPCDLRRGWSPSEQRKGLPEGSASARVSYQPDRFRRLLRSWIYS
jgi:fructose-1-phosphate kinase PfkB-like protein